MGNAARQLTPPPKSTGAHPLTRRRMKLVRLANPYRKARNSRRLRKNQWVPR